MILAVVDEEYGYTYWKVDTPSAIAQLIEDGTLWDDDDPDWILENNPSVTHLGDAHYARFGVQYAKGFVDMWNSNIAGNKVLCVTDVVSYPVKMHWEQA